MPDRVPASTQYLHDGLPLYFMNYNSISCGVKREHFQKHKRQSAHTIANLYLSPQLWDLKSYHLEDGSSLNSCVKKWALSTPKTHHRYTHQVGFWHFWTVQFWKRYLWLSPVCASLQTSSAQRACAPRRKASTNLVSWELLWSQFQDTYLSNLWSRRGQHLEELHSEQRNTTRSTHFQPCPCAFFKTNKCKASR